MNYLKCVVIYLIIALIVGVFDITFKALFKKNTPPILIRVLLCIIIGGYTIYYLLNIYIK